MSRSIPNRIWMAFEVALGRAVDELSDDRLTLADLATPAILGDD